MRRGIVKIMAVLILGTAMLSGCAIDNQRYHKRGYHDRHRYDRYHNRYDNRDHDRGYGYGYNK